MSTPTKKKKYQVTLTIADKKYAGKGESVFEALNEIKLSGKIVSRGTISVSYGEKKAEKIMYVHQLKRTFYSELSKQIWGKRFETMLV